MYEDEKISDIDCQIQASIGEYTSNEKRLFTSLIAIWENRQFIDNDDLDNLKFFENKGI